MISEHVVQGDCIEGLNRLPEAAVDLAFADPPFNIGYKYDVYHDGRDDEDYLNWTRDWARAVVRVLKPNGTFWVAIGDEYAAELKWILHRELGLTMRSWVIWYYTFGVNCTRKFSRSHVHLLYFVKDAASFTFNDDAIRVPSARQLIYADVRANPRGRLPDDTWVLRPQDVPEGFTPDQDTWSVPRVCGTFKERAGFHGCQMPEKVLERIILTCSNPGDWVLDPFAGSGTTLATAKRLGRMPIGFELSADYAAAIQRRLDAVVVQSPGLDRSNPLNADGSAWFITPQRRRAQPVDPPAAPAPGAAAPLTRARKGRPLATRVASNPEESGNPTVEEPSVVRARQRKG